MKLPPERARTVIGVTLVILLAAALVVPPLVWHGPPARTACAGPPTRHTVIRIPGQRATADLSLYLRHGQTCASVHGPSRAVVGVELEACTNAAGPGLPGQCTSTADTPNGQEALHQLGTSTITLAAPTKGSVIALGSLGSASGPGSAAIRLTIAPGPSQTPTPHPSHPPTLLPPHRGAPGPQLPVTNHSPTAAAA